MSNLLSFQSIAISNWILTYTACTYKLQLTVLNNNLFVHWMLHRCCELQYVCRLIKYDCIEIITNKEQENKTSYGFHSEYRRVFISELKSTTMLSNNFDYLPLKLIGNLYSSLIKAG